MTSIEPPSISVAAAMGGATTARTDNQTSQTTSSDGMDGNTFLQLLVAQLKYQDPTKPADSTAMLAQTAQFHMVETLQQLSEQNAQLLSQQGMLNAVTLVGRTVSYSQDGQTASGTVGSVRMTADGPLLGVGGAEVPLSAVTSIASGSTAGSATPTV